MAKKLLTIKQASEKLGVSTKTIRRWESQGKIESIRTSGGHRRFKLKEISPETTFSLKSVYPFITIAVLAALISFQLTRSLYQQKINIIKDQIDVYISQDNIKEINTITSDNQTIVDSGVDIIDPVGNGSILVKTNHIQNDSGINISSADEDKLIVSQVFSDIGFIVSINKDITSPIYFNWEISN